MPVTQRETSAELTYSINLASWLYIQPNVQYIINPGTDPSVDDALVAGLRINIGWNFTR